MRVRLVVLSLVLLFSSVCFSSCSIQQDTPVTYPLTPLNTSASSLFATVNIVDDENALDDMSDVTLHFSTSAVKEGNYALFSHQESVVCNDVTQKLSNVSSYALKVRRGDYTCFYTGNNQGAMLTPILMISVLTRSMLRPQQPTLNGQTYTIVYTADSSAQAASCRVRAEASDTAGNEADGAWQASDSGIYSTPLSSSLTGQGSILLRRSCSWNLTDTFRLLSITYLSLARIAVTWSH